MTLVVTRNTPDRFGGFLASCMLEAAPGVFLAPHMSRGVRDRIWTVMLEWASLLPEDAGIAVFWNDRKRASGLGMHVLGWPKKEMIAYGGLWMARRDLTASHPIEELAALAAAKEGLPEARDPVIEWGWPVFEGSDAEEDSGAEEGSEGGHA